MARLGPLAFLTPVDPADPNHRTSNTYLGQNVDTHPFKMWRAPDGSGYRLVRAGGEHPTPGS